ncbi:MAG: hypothetical protein ACLFO5_05685 [Opitutales bacterium]
MKLRILYALFAREFHAVRASRIVWVFAAACILFGITAGMGGEEPETAIWLLLPMTLYMVPLLGLMVGVTAAHGDASEEPLLGARLPGALPRIAVKWLAWTTPLGLAGLLWITPAVFRTGELGLLPALWAYAFGEAFIFVALGLALGRLLHDGVTAHTSALLTGFLLIAGAGILGWLTAQSPYFQERPHLWTLGLMLHPVEAVRVSLMFSLQNLPFAAGELPDLAAWWLRHSGAWYAGLVLVWSALALSLATLRRPAV